MWQNEPRPLPPLAEEAFDVITDRFEDSQDGFSWEQTFEVLGDADFEESEVEYVVELLLTRGHLYEVDDHLFITLTD